MGTTQLPYSVPPCKGNQIFPERFIVLSDLLALITTDLSPKIYHLCIYLYSQVITTISGFVIKRLDLKGSPVTDTLRGHLLQFMSKNAAFTAFFLHHPALAVIHKCRPNNEPSRKFEGDIISYDLLEQDPTVALAIEEDITSADPTALVKSTNLSYRSSMNSFILAANILQLYMNRCTSVPLSLSNYVGEFLSPSDIMLKLNGVRAALVTSVELRISQARDRVYSWLISPKADVITDGESDLGTLDKIYPVPSDYPLPGNPPSIFPIKADLPEVDPWGIPRKSIDFDLEYEARSAIRNYNVQAITLYSSYVTEDSPYKSTPPVSPIELPRIEDDPDLEEAGYIF
jgi:hypothetical protein